MGSLTPDVKLIYERVDDTVYARREGETERTVVGYHYENKIDPRTSDGRPLMDHIMESKLWGEIHRAARTNPTLQQALDRVKILYYISKEGSDKPSSSNTLDW